MIVERAERNQDYFREVELEIPFDEISNVASARGVHIDETDYGHVRWLWLAGNEDVGFAYARVGSKRREDGSEKAFAFAGELDRLNHLLFAGNQVLTERSKER